MSFLSSYCSRRTRDRHFFPTRRSSDLRAVHDEVNFGVPLQQALTHLSERVPITDLRYFVVAVLIQRESGGNLTEIDRKSTRLNSSHPSSSYAAFCLKKKTKRK